MRFNDGLKSGPGKGGKFRLGNVLGNVCRLWDYNSLIPVNEDVGEFPLNLAVLELHVQMHMQWKGGNSFHGEKLTLCIL